MGKLVSEKMSRKQREEHEKNMEMPINKFLNSDLGSVSKIRNYFLNNIDEVMIRVRLVNAQLHELRWRKEQARKYLEAYHSQNVPSLLDDRGHLMSKEECYLAFLSMTHNQHRVVADLRKHLVHEVLKYVDGDRFTFEQYDQLVVDVEKKVRDLGFVLFPEKVDLEFE